MIQSRDPQDTKEFREAESAAVRVSVPAPPESDFGADLPPELKDVAGAWDDLPDAIRAAILAMVWSTQKQRIRGRSIAANGPRSDYDQVLFRQMRSQEVPETNARVGGMRNDSSSSMTSSRGGGVSSSRPFWRNAFQ